MNEITTHTLTRNDVIRFVSNALVHTYGSADGYNVETAVDEMAEAAGSYDVVGLSVDEFWNIMGKHEIDTEPEIEAYRLTLKSVLDGSFRDMIVDDSDISTKDEAFSYGNSIISSAWVVIDIQEIPA